MAAVVLRRCVPDEPSRREAAGPPAETLSHAPLPVADREDGGGMRFANALRFLAPVTRKAMLGVLRGTSAVVASETLLGPREEYTRGLPARASSFHSRVIRTQPINSRAITDFSTDRPDSIPLQLSSRWPPECYCSGYVPICSCGRSHPRTNQHV